MNILEIQNLKKYFATQKAVDDISMTIEQGSIFGLLGPNGAGKTTLIRMITGIFHPDSGEIFLKGKKFDAENDARYIGYMPEERGLYKKMKIGEQALYLARLKGMSKSHALEKIKEWFKRLEMENWWNKKVEDLSKGMGQKLQFVITVLHEPDLIILDEPFSGLDPLTREELIGALLECLGVVWQADAHEVACECLGQMFSIGRNQPQSRAACLRELVQESFRQREQPVKRDHRPGKRRQLVALVQQRQSGNIPGDEATTKLSRAQGRIAVGPRPNGLAPRGDRGEKHLFHLVIVEVATLSHDDEVIRFGLNHRVIARRQRIDRVHREGEDGAVHEQIALH